MVTNQLKHLHCKLRRGQSMVIKPVFVACLLLGLFVFAATPTASQEHEPAPDLGFESAVEEAVTKWRFAPSPSAQTDLSSYTGTVTFEPSIAREWIYPVESQVAWTAIRAIAQELKLGAEKRNDKDQLLLTRWQRYDSRFPPQDRLKLDVGHQAYDVQFHLYVTPGMEPARVAIGSILKTRNLQRREEGRLYSHDVLSEWLLVRLSQRLAATPEALSLSAEGRAEQSRRLMPSGVTDTCAAVPAVLVPRDGENSVSFIKPRPLSRIIPVFPREELEGRHQSQVQFEAEITEHGTLINVKHSNPTEVSDGFRRAAQLAGSLWRFAPASVGACRSRITAVFSMNFVLR